MHKKMYFFLMLLFLISRVYVITTAPVFFDSNEYINLFSSHHYFQAIVSGHFPPHVGYIILFLPVYHAAQTLHLHPLYTIIIGQIVLAALTIYCFYVIISFLSNKRIALIASVIASITPLFFITNVTIMMEIVYTSFFFFSLYFLIRYLTHTKKTLFLHASALLFAFAFLTHMLVLLWFPLYLAIVYIKKRTVVIRIFLTLFIYLIISSLFNLLFIASVSQTSIPAVFHHLYLTKGNELASFSYDIKGILIALRNFLVPLLRNNTSLLVILGFVGLLVMFRKNKSLFLIGVLWIFPALYANQWWDSLLNGRHALIVGFGCAFVVAYLINKKTPVVIAVIVYLLVVSFPAIMLLKQQIPYLEEAQAVATLPKDSLLIETHFAKPQIEKTFPGKLMAVNDPLTNTEAIQKEITSFITQKKPVFISSGALSEPYGLYSGPYLHNITLSYAKPFELTNVITQFTLKPYKVINKKDNLILYKITTDKPSPYPNVPSLRESHRRLDYYDPFWRIYRLLTK